MIIDRDFITSFLISKGWEERNNESLKLGNLRLKYDLNIVKISLFINHRIKRMWGMNTIKFINDYDNAMINLEKDIFDKFL